MKTILGTTAMTIPSPKGAVNTSISLRFQGSYQESTPVDKFSKRILVENTMLEMKVEARLNSDMETL